MKNIMETSWYLKYCPQTIEDLVFDNDDHKKIIFNFVENEQIQGNLLLYGPAGLGKSASANLLINTIIKAQNDLLILKDRSVKEIREKVLPFVTKRPTRSNQKIVLIEEADKLHKEAENVLKTNTLELYQKNTSFIACTNYIKKIDEALLTRFNTKIAFVGTNVIGITERLTTILKSENAQFNETDLKKYVETNLKMGIRELINQLQFSFNSNNQQIDFNTISTTGGNEIQIINLIMMILKQSIKANIKDKKMILDFPENSSIATQYKELIIILNNNYDINYDYIYNQLYNAINYIPVKLIIGKSANISSNKTFPHIELLSCYYDMLQSIITINRI